MGECFQVLLVEPLAKHLHDALDSTLDYAVRDYADKESMKLRGQVCNGFRAESSLIYIARRTSGITGADARATSFLGSNLLSMPLSDMFRKLPPIFVLSKPKLVAATKDADSIAAQFSACEIAKTKLHLTPPRPRPSRTRLLKGKCGQQRAMLRTTPTGTESAARTTQPLRRCDCCTRHDRWWTLRDGGRYAGRTVRYRCSALLAA